MEHMTKEEFIELCNEPREIIMYVSPRLSKEIDIAFEEYYRRIKCGKGRNSHL